MSHNTGKVYIKKSGFSWKKFRKKSHKSETNPEGDPRIEMFGSLLFLFKPRLTFSESLVNLNAKWQLEVTKVT